MDRAADRRVLIIVPSHNLKSQWATDAKKKFQIELQTKEFVYKFNDDFQGGVATYQHVASATKYFTGICQKHPVMVIFDEMHHCADQASWGEAIKGTTATAKERLMITGTAWRSDNRTIPYVQYENGYVKADYRYGLESALKDGIVRPVIFDHAKGSIENDRNGEISMLDEETDERESSRILNRLLTPRGEYVRQIIRDAHARLTQYRKWRPKAAAMAACIDREHAQAMAEVIQEETGCRAHIIVDDVEMATTSIDDFRNGSDPWLVSVRQVSEGTDIKRLMVLCYLTNATTPLFFRQLVGRVQRVTGPDEEASVFLPAHPELIENAKTMEREQVCALAERDCEIREPIERSEMQSMLFESYTTRHHGSGLVLVNTEAIEQPLYSHLCALASKHDLPIGKIYQVITDHIRHAAEAIGTPVQEPNYKSIEEQKDELRTQAQKLAAQIRTATGNDFNEIHVRHNGGRRTEEMTMKQLKAKIESMRKELDRLWRRS